MLDRIPEQLRVALAASASEHRSTIQNRLKLLAEVHGAVAAQQARKGLIKAAEQLFIEEALQALRSVQFSRNTRSYCTACCAECKIAPPMAADDFWIEVAGTTCVAFSSMGSHWGWLDPSGLPCLVWLEWVFETEPDAVVHEIVPGCRTAVMERVLGPKYHINTSVTSPILWGVPSSRPRRYTVSLKKSLQLRRPDPGTGGGGGAGEEPSHLEPHCGENSSCGNVGDASMSTVGDNPL
jgi:hypothetical protein